MTYGLLTEMGIAYSNEPVSMNSWGKPYLKNFPDVHYNISHCENYAACVISHTYAVGIDVEKIRSFSPYAAKRVCSSKELDRIYSASDSDREFFRYWTLKESYIKAIGRGVSHPMKSVNFEISDSKEIYSDLPRCSFLLMEDTKGFITAVCYTEVHDRD